VAVYTAIAFPHKIVPLLSGTRVASFYEWAIAAEAYTGVESPLQLREDPALARVVDRHQPFMGRASRQRPVRRVVASADDVDRADVGALQSIRHRVCPVEPQSAITAGLSPVGKLTCRCAGSTVGAGATTVAWLFLLKLMTGCERRYIDCQAHGVIACMIGVQIVPRQLSELAVG
jgi:hypothetical protein